VHVKYKRLFLLDYGGVCQPLRMAWSDFFWRKSRRKMFSAYFHRLFGWLDFYKPLFLRWKYIFGKSDRLLGEAGIWIPEP
jgi:hypothetical protein